MKRTTVVLVVAAALLLAVTVPVLAMSSPNYQLEWFTPLTSGGGGPAISANYAVNLTVGQTVIGTSSGAAYGACLGYWCGIPLVYRVYLPMALRGW